MTICIQYTDSGRIVNLCDGDRSGAWLGLDNAKFPDGGPGKWQPESPGEGLILHLFYRPETPNDTPPDRFNDDPGPSGWHATSTATIGVVFEKSESEQL
jgi:hypothetical protein